jgi:hypothetical protein
MKRHYETTHILQLSSLQGQLRKDKINQLKKISHSTKEFIHNTSLQSDAAVHANYVVSGILARKN